jgi:Secretion system C-terminal sorting domain
MGKKKSTLLLITIIFTISLFGYYSLERSKDSSKELALKILKNKLTKENDRDKDGDMDGIRDMLQWQFSRLRDPHTNAIPQNIRENELAFAKTLPNANQLQLKKGAKIFSTADWSFRGPNNQGGRTKGVAIDAANENVYIIGAAEGGIWRSTDKGSTWTETTDPSVVQNVDCLVQDTRTGKTNTWYYGTGEMFDNYYPGGSGLYGGLLGDGIFKSTDDGQTWQQLAKTKANSPNQFSNPFQIVWDIAIDTANYSQDVLYAACPNGIYRSTDAGNSWNRVLSNVQNGYLGFYSDVTIDNVGGVYASISYTDSAGIYYASDGINFKNITPNFYPSNVSRIVLTTAPSDKNILYAFANTPGSGQAGDPDNGSDDYNSLWRYNATSMQWTDLSSKLPTWFGSVGGISTQGGYDMVIKVKPDNTNFVIIGGTNIYRTTDGFSTKLDSTDWIGGYSTQNDISQYTGSHPDQHAFFFSPFNSKECLSGNDGGISVTSDITAQTVVWSQMDEGYRTAQFWSISLDKGLAGDPFLVGGMQDNGSMVDASGNTTASDWDDVAGGDGTTTAIADSANSFYFSTQNGNIYRVNKSYDWTEITPQGASGFLFVTPYILDPNNSSVMFLAAGKKLWRNSNLLGIALKEDQNPTSKNWSVFQDSASSSITALGMTKAVNNLIYFGTDDGHLYKTAAANNTNTSFTEITGSNFPSSVYISSIDVDPNNGNNVLVSFSNYNVLSIFYSTDGGSSWTSEGGNLEQNSDGSGNGPSVSCVKILPVQGSNMYLAGTSTGLYITTSLDGTNTQWVEQSPNTIGNVVIETMDVRPLDGTVVVGTYGKGVFSSKITATGIAEQPNVPMQYSLQQNYPNPFNPSTKINYSVQKSGLVSLKVYDSIGRLVKTLVSGYENPGSYNVTFNADNAGIASGVYFYRLQVNNFVSTKKMILLK